MMVSTDTLLVHGMQFWGTHGYFPEENKLGQKFIIDVEVNLDMTDMCQNDDLDKGFSYVSVYEITKRVVTTEQYKLLQRLAQRIADEIMAAYPIERVKVTVKKPSVAIGGILDYTGVTIVREPGGSGNGSAVQL